MAAYSLSLRNNILPAFGDKTCLSENDVQAFVLEKIKKGLSPKTVKDIVTLLKMIQNYGARNGWIDHSEWYVK